MSKVQWAPTTSMTTQQLTCEAMPVVQPVAVLRMIGFEYNETAFWQAAIYLRGSAGGAVRSAARNIGRLVVRICRGVRLHKDTRA